MIWFSVHMFCYRNSHRENQCHFFRYEKIHPKKKKNIYLIKQLDGFVFVNKNNTKNGKKVRKKNHPLC